MIRQPLSQAFKPTEVGSLPGTFPAPVGGLNSRDAEAAMAPHFAREMVNFWPSERYVGIRGGWQPHKTGFAKPIKHMASWRGPAAEKLFAITDDGIFDATAAGAVGATVQALTNGQCVSTNFAISGGSYLVGVNGTDNLWHYNGSAWTSVATYTVGAGPATIATNKFSYVAPHQRALFFVEKDSMNFYYLGINSIGGAANVFPLGALFKEGGKLVAIGSWTLDGGINGQDDVAVFVTSQGQCAIYLGSDPSDPAKWSLQGVYSIGKPLGHNPLVNIGGDLCVLTTFGLVSLTQVLKVGSVSQRTAYTNQISATFQSYARAFETAAGWQAIVNPYLNALIINVPNTTSRGKTQLAMNLLTTAWTEFEGWDARAWSLFGADLYSGFDKTVGKTWTPSDDNGMRIQAYCRLAWNFLKPRTSKKQVNLVRFYIRLGGQIRAQAGMDTDFESSLDWQTIAQADEDISRWNVDTFNNAQWSTLPSMLLDWLTLPTEEGYCVAPRLRVFAGDATFEWSAMDYSYQKGHH